MQQRAESARHLKWAIERYRQALDVNETHLIARLGLAWCLEQAGKKSDAIAEYWRVFDQAWPQEYGLPRQRQKPFVTYEAGRRLLVLLGPEATLDEVRRIQVNVNATTPDSVRAEVVVVDSASGSGATSTSTA